MYSSSKNIISIQDSNVTFNRESINYSGSLSRFKFNLKDDAYIVKISNDILTLYKNNLVLDTLLKEYTPEQQDTLEKYIIKEDLYVSINAEKTIIFLNNKELQITKKYKNGSSDVYETNEGVLSLSTNLSRNSTWNGITIMKK